MALAVDSNWDGGTRAAFDYREANVYPYLVSHGFTVRRCQGLLARRVHVAPVARDPAITYMTGVGHGFPGYYTGDHLDHVFEVGVYDPAEAHGKIIHLLSCSTAVSLGKSFVSDGCRAFFGYDKPFYFDLGLIDVYVECDSEIDLRFADGLTANDVYDKTIEAFNRGIAKLRADGHVDAAGWLEFDMKHLMAPKVDPQFGDGTATI